MSERLRPADEVGLIFEHAPEAILSVDSSGGVLRANGRAHSVFGYGQGELVGSEIDVLMPGLLSAGETRTARSGRRKDGSELTIEVATASYDLDGRAATIVTIRELDPPDAGERARLEGQLRQVQKLDAIGGLAGGIAHDFNNLVTVIRGYSSNLAHRLEDKTALRSVRQIDRAAERAAELTAQLLAFSRQQVLRPEVSDLNAVVDETLGLLERLLGPDISLESRLDHELAPVLVDRAQIAQVILNLAVNAREAMADGGTLVIRTKNVRLDDVYARTHADVTAGSYVLLEVTDSGPGIDEETLGRVFDPFFTTKESGTGLGLSTVYGIVKQSGGHIWLYSEPGFGTTFKVYFPSTDAAAGAPTPPPPVESLDGTETILLVEDTEMLRTLVAEALESYGYTVLAAAGGAQALELAAREDTPRIDLLLTDVVMPLMNGREVAEKLVADRPGLRVLFTSGYPSDTVVRHGIAEARTAFIQKPYLAADLARKIREVLSDRPEPGER